MFIKKSFIKKADFEPPVFVIEAIRNKPIKQRYIFKALLWHNMHKQLGKLMEYFVLEILHFIIFLDVSTLLLKGIRGIGLKI